MIARLTNGAEFGFRDAATARRLHPDAKVVGHQDGTAYEADGDDAPNLSTMSRDALNAYAEKIGIGGAAGLPNKDAVIAAIEGED